MIACWELDPLKRPTFSEICETLDTFLNEHDEYERGNTREIDDDYYTHTEEGDDSPIYCSHDDDIVTLSEYAINYGIDPTASAHAVPLYWQLLELV
mgnify:CR=1 FL=1